MAQQRTRSSNPKSDLYDPEFALEQELLADRERLGGKKGLRDDEDEKLLDPEDVISNIRAAIDLLRPDAEAKDAAVAARHRTRDVKFSWPLPSLIGYVNARGMQSLATHAFRGAQDALRAVQSTGDWQIAAFVVQKSIQRRTIPQIKQGPGGQDPVVYHEVEDRVVVVAVRFIDLRNGEEVVYKNGRPTSDENVPAWLRAALEDRFRPQGDTASAPEQAALADENRLLRERLDRMEAMLQASLPPTVAVPEEEAETTWGGEGEEAEDLPPEEAALSELDLAMAEAPPATPRRGPGRPRKDRPDANSAG